MNNCKICNKEINESAQICAECRQKLLQEEAIDSQNEEKQLDEANKDNLLKSKLKNNELKNTLIIIGITYGFTLLFSIIITIVLKKVVLNFVDDSIGGLIGLMFFDIEDMIKSLFNPITAINFMLNNSVNYYSGTNIITSISIGIIAIQLVVVISFVLSYLVYLKLLKLRKISLYHIIIISIGFSWLQAILNAIFTIKLDNIDSIRGGSLYLLFILPIYIILLNTIVCNILNIEIDYSILKKKFFLKIFDIEVINKFNSKSTFIKNIKNFPLLIAFIGGNLVFVFLKFIFNTKYFNISILKKFIIGILLLPNLLLTSIFNSLGIPLELAKNGDKIVAYGFDEATIPSILFVILMSLIMLIFVLNVVLKKYEKKAEGFIKSYIKYAIIVWILSLMIINLITTRVSLDILITNVDLLFGFSIIKAGMIIALWCIVPCIIVIFANKQVNKIINRLHIQKNSVWIIISILILSFILAMPFKTNKEENSNSLFGKESLEYETLVSEEINYLDIYMIGKKEFLVEYNNNYYLMNIKKKSFKKIENIDNVEEKEIIYFSLNQIIFEGKDGIEIYNSDFKLITNEPIKIQGDIEVSLDEEGIYEYDTNRVFNLKGEPLYKIKDEYKDIILISIEEALMINDENKLGVYNLKESSFEPLIENYNGEIMKVGNNAIYKMLDEEGNIYYQIYSKDDKLIYDNINFVTNYEDWLFDYDKMILYEIIDGKVNEEEPIMNFGEELTLLWACAETGELLFNNDFGYYYYNINEGILRSLPVEMKEVTINE